MRILILIFVFGLVSCSTSNQQSKEETVEGSESIVEPVIEEIEEVNWAEIDRSFFADVTYFLTSTSEFYIPMSFKGDVEYTAYIELEENLDSLVYSDPEDGIYRTRLKKEVATKYFETRFLDELMIFDVDGQFSTKGRLTRFERFEGNIEDGYIAVIQPEQLPQNNQTEFFVIGGLNTKLPRIPIQLNKLKSISDNVRTSLNVQEKVLWTNDQLIFDKKEFNILSYYSSSDSSPYSYLLRIAHDSVSVIKLLKDREGTCFNSVIPLPLLFNQKQVFLAILGITETDASWNSLLFFNGTEYELENRMRILKN
jgi:hypothetical protein